MRTCRRQMLFFFFKQKTAYEMRISDWSSDVCSSDLGAQQQPKHAHVAQPLVALHQRLAVAADVGVRHRVRAAARAVFEAVVQRFLAEDESDLVGVLLLPDFHPLPLCHPDWEATPLFR